jgi:hypothetical protein
LSSHSLAENSRLAPGVKRVPAGQPQELA